MHDIKISSKAPNISINSITVNYIDCTLSRRSENSTQNGIKRKCQKSRKT